MYKVSFVCLFVGSFLLSSSFGLNRRSDCRFLGLYNREGVECVSLDEAASRLGVERRRIYDIVNVVESVGVRFSLDCFSLSCFFYFVLFLKFAHFPLFFFCKLTRFALLLIPFCFSVSRFSAGKLRIDTRGLDLKEFPRHWRV